MKSPSWVKLVGMSLPCEIIFGVLSFLGNNPPRPAVSSSNSRFIKRSLSLAENSHNLSFADNVTPKLMNCVCCCSVALLAADFVYLWFVFSAPMLRLDLF